MENFWAHENLRTAFVFPNTRQITYTHDNLNRLDAMEGIQYEYIGRGRILERTNPNGTALSYLTGSDDTGYDGLGRIVHQKTMGPSSSVLADFEYTHDREGHRKTARRLHQLNGSNQPKGEFYDYDSAYRLTDWKESWVIADPLVIPAGGGTFTFSASGSATISVIQTGGFPIATQVRGVVGTATDTQNWTLDGVGNWEQMKRKGTATNNSLDPFNQYTSWGGTAQSHDSNGNLLDDGVYLYQYDFLNRMRTITLKSTMTLVASYAYDALNRRVEATVSSVSTRFLYDGWHAVEERVSESVSKQFVYGQGLDEVLKMDSYASGEISATHYYHTDALGSVIALTDSAGAIVERVKYSPYGQPYWMNASNQVQLDGSGNYVNASTVGNPLLFTAARYDAETANRTNSQITDSTGAYYLRNRYLDSDKGRFTTRDPIGIWGDEINLGGGQTYCGNDPVNNWDPMGLICAKGKLLPKPGLSEEDTKEIQKIIDALLSTPEGQRLLEMLNGLTQYVDFNRTRVSHVTDVAAEVLFINPDGNTGIDMIRAEIGEGPLTEEQYLAGAAGALAHELAHRLDRLTHGELQRRINTGRMISDSNRHYIPTRPLGEDAAHRMGNAVRRSLLPSMRPLPLGGIGSFPHWNW